MVRSSVATKTILNFWNVVNANKNLVFAQVLLNSPWAFDKEALHTLELGFSNYFRITC